MKKRIHEVYYFYAFWKSFSDGQFVKSEVVLVLILSDKSSCFSYCVFHSLLAIGIPFFVWDFAVCVLADAICVLHFFACLVWFVACIMRFAYCVVCFLFCDFVCRGWLV